MGKVELIRIGRRDPFSLEEARRLLPTIRRVTERYSQQVEAMMLRLETLGNKSQDVALELEETINNLIKEWHVKMNKLGASAKGLWLVDLDAGDGYFCWKHPEPDILYWHSYKEGFKGRRPLSDKRERVSLQEEVRESLSPYL